MNNRIKTKLQTVEQVSAGGVVFRERNSRLQVVIVSVNPSLRWQLPKGIVDDGETPEITAVREVREEAGIDADLVMPIETIEYWYVGEQHQTNNGRVRFHKFVHFYLLKYRDGDIKDHDHEIAEARWMTPHEAVRMLAFKNEKDVVKKAMHLIS